MLRCEQTLCRYCLKHYTGIMVCSTDPVFVIAGPDIQPEILRCGTYRDRVPNQQTELQPGRGTDGLYPGQFKEPKS